MVKPYLGRDVNVSEEFNLKCGVNSCEPVLVRGCGYSTFLDYSFNLIRIPLSAPGVLLFGFEQKTKAKFSFVQYFHYRLSEFTLLTNVH